MGEKMKTRMFLSLLIVPALLFAAIEVKVPSQEEGTGCYLIGNAEELYGFADVVKSSSSACGKLTANIVVNKNVLNDDGSLNCTPANVWTPIESFSGTFNGNGFYISGLYVNSSLDTAGFFARVRGTDDNPVIISNFGLVDSYIGNGVSRTGAFIGYALGKITIENCYNEATIDGGTDVGGLVGIFDTDWNIQSSSLVIKNSYNEGIVSGQRQGALGGFVGFCNGSVRVTSCYNSGYVINGQYGMGGFGGVGSGPLDIENSFVTQQPFGALWNPQNIHVTNSYYPDANKTCSEKMSENVCDATGACPACMFTNGQILDSLVTHDPAGADNSVWRFTEGDEHPTINVRGTADKIITLSWSSAGDSIALKDSSFDVVEIAEGKQFYANGKIYSGILSDADVSAIGDSVLYPIGGISFETENGKRIVTLDGDSVTALAFPPDFHADSVIFKRSFKEGVISTVMLPFSAKVSGGTFYTFAGVTDSTVNGDTVWVAEWEEVAAESNLAANVPYMVVPSGNSLTVQGAVNFTSEGPKKYSVGNWDFNGPYTYRFFAETDEIGKAYGFASKTKTVGESLVAAGTFVKAASGAKIRPLRGFLIYNPKTPKNSPRAKFAPGTTHDNASLPSKIEIRLLKISNLDETGNSKNDEKLDEKTTSLVKAQSIAPKSTNLWYDMNGREFNRKPGAKGRYINNGKMVIVK